MALAVSRGLPTQVARLWAHTGTQQGKDQAHSLSLVTSPQGGAPGAGAGGTAPDSVSVVPRLTLSVHAGPATARKGAAPQ